jgi:hypothetical protein
MPEQFPVNNESVGGIKKMRIPDDAMVGWIEFLRDENFGEKEIDGILSKLNRTYRDKEHPDWVEKQMQYIESCLKRDYGRVLTEEQKNKFRKFAQEKL